MRKLFPVLVLLTALICGAAEKENLSAEAFLARARYPETGRSMAALNGMMQYKKQVGTMETVPIYLGLLIEPGQTRGQLILNEDEGYWIDQALRQSADGGVAVSVRPIHTRPEQSRLQRYGLNPTDLTMGFLHYDLVRELPADRIKGLPCRVLVLAAKGGEAVRAYILRDYYFPLKVEFFADTAAAEKGQNMCRTLEVGSFRQKNGLYYAEVINLRGPDWRSRVTFNQAELSVPPVGALPPFREMRSQAHP